MKIIIVSDSHGNRDILEFIVKNNQDVSIFLHAGDSCLSRYEINPFLSVKGNCDYDDAFVEELFIQTPYGKLYLTHGHHLFSINKEKIMNLGAKIFVYGHTHKKMSTKIDDLYIFNPGSAVLPRDGNRGSYLKLDISKDNVKYEFVYLN